VGASFAPKTHRQKKKKKTIKYDRNGYGQEVALFKGRNVTEHYKLSNTLTSNARGGLTTKEAEKF